MNLFINAVSQKGMLILFDDNRKILFEKKIEILGNESSKLIEIIDIFLNENKIKYFDLENLIVINGPGSFTGIRTIILAINTINFIIKKNITSLSFFDLFENYPIIKSSSRRDLFVKNKKNDIIKIVKNSDFFSEGKIYGDLSNNILSEKIKINSDIDYKKIIKKIVFKKDKLIKALYIKKPNIS